MPIDPRDPKYWRPFRGADRPPQDLKVGDEIVPATGRYPDDAFRIARIHADESFFYQPAGGGLMYQMPRERWAEGNWRVVTSDERRRVTYRYSPFQIEDGPMYWGWTDGSLWNGWATPHFELDEAKRLMNNYNEVMGDRQIRWYEDSETFVIEEPEYPANEWEELTATTVETPYGPKKTWGIGAWNWIWSEIEQPEEEEL